MRSMQEGLNRQRDIDLHFAQVSALSQNFGLAWLGLREAEGCEVKESRYTV
jgi:hypothetical protein